MSKVKDLIEKQRAKLENDVETTLQVVAGDELVTVGVMKVLPPVWDGLIGDCPARPGREDDAQMGYNPKALSRRYPNITIDGEDVDPAEWGELFDILDPVHRNNIELTIWGVNINETLIALRTLGKAQAGQK